jgi:hypothetical protein
MQAYKFDTRISKNGTITIPYTPDLIDKDVELIILPKEAGFQKITQKELVLRTTTAENDITSQQTLTQEELEKDSLSW